MLLDEGWRARRVDWWKTCMCRRNALVDVAACEGTGFGSFQSQKIMVGVARSLGTQAERVVVFSCKGRGVGW